MDGPSKSPIAKPPPLPKTEPPKFEPRPMPKSRGDGMPAVPVQRKCACAACSDCEKKKPMQRAAAGPAPESVPPSVTFAMEASRGGPLPEPLRETMESRFGRDFDSVRVFTDSHAAVAAKNANARAFTSGDRIYFAEGEYQPDSERGRELIAHELTHVVQQKSGRATAAGIGAHDDAFEHEAERAAQAIVRGERPAVAMNDGARPIRRIAADKMRDQATKPLPKDKPFRVPAAKTSPLDKDIEGIYSRAVQSHALRTSKAGRSREVGTATDTLWDKWASTRPLTYFDGGVKNDATKKKLIKERKDAKCQVDHILELQVGGADDPNNMRLLDGDRNVKAGRDDIWNNQLRPLFANEPLMTSIGVPPKSELPIVEFSASEMEGVGPADPGCLDWEIAKRGNLPLAGAAGQETIDTKISGSEAAIFFAEKKVVNQSRYVVPSFDLGEVTKATDPLWQIKGTLAENLVRIPRLKPDPSYTFNVQTAKAEIKLSNNKLKTEFPSLSETFLEMRIENRDLIAEGLLKPTHPLFKYIDITLRIEKEKLTAKAEITPEKLKNALPIPGLEFTNVDLALAFGKNDFTATGGFGIKYTTIATGKATATFGAKGFEAAGELLLNVPGLTEAKGTVWYREKKLGGQIDIGAKQLKIPGVSNAKLQVLIADGVLSGSGTVDLGVPGVKKASLAFLIDPKGNFSVTGSAAIKAPGLKEGEVKLVYANNDLTGLAKLALAVPGLESATFDILYAKGALSGKGEIGYKKGKLSGKIRAELTPKHKFLGGGELAYEIFPGVTAAVGLQIEDDKTIVSGEVRVPEAFNLFALREYNKKLFSFGLQIPIFAIPLGPKSVGLVADIGADISARAGVGPGQLRGVKAKATIDLSKDDNALAFAAAAELYIPAYAYLRVAVHGGLGLSIAIASATGGIELAAMLGLQGALAVPVQINYQNGIFVVDAAAEITAQPVLKFDISAYVKVELDLWITTIEVYRKDWKLASREWGSGLVVGLRFPVHFESNKPFALSLDQVQFIRPEIDVMKAVKDLLPM